MHDTILGASNWALVIALLVSIPRERMWLTGPITCIALGVIACVFADMHYWRAFEPVSCATLCWLWMSLRAIWNTRRVQWASYTSWPINSAT